VLSTLRDCIAERDALRNSKISKESTDTALQEVVEESRDDGNQVNDDKCENSRVTSIDSTASAVTSKKRVLTKNNNKTNEVVVDSSTTATTSEGMFEQLLAHLHDKRAPTNGSTSSVGKTNKVVVVKSLLSSNEGLPTIQEGDGDLEQGRINEIDGIVAVGEASCWSAFTSFFFYSDIDCDSVVIIDDKPQTQVMAHSDIPFASSTSILRSRSFPETPRERAWPMDKAVAPGERQETKNKQNLPEEKAAKKEGMLPRFLKIVCMDEILVEHITQLDVNSNDVKVGVTMKKRALEEAIKANEEATARIVALLQHYNETKTEFDHNVDRNVDREENKLKKEAADAGARVAEMEHEIRAKSEALTKEMDMNLQLQDQIIRLTESIAKSWDEELMNYQSRLEKKILLLEYDLEAGKKTTLEAALKEIFSELGYIDNCSARRVQVLQELLDKTTTTLASFDSALHDQRAFVDEQLQTQIRSLQSQQQSFEELLTAASITEQECAQQMNVYLSIVESIEESLKQSSSNNESQEHDDILVIDEELAQNTNEVVVVTVDSNEVIDLELCDSIGMCCSDEHPKMTFSVIETEASKQSSSDIDAQELVSVSINEEVLPMINQVEEVEPNELIDLLQNESIEMICCPEVPDTPSAMKTDIKTASSKDDNSVHSSTNFLLTASKSDDFEVNVANAASPSPQSLFEKESFHDGPSLPDSLYEYYARESVSPCSLDDVIVVEGPSHPNSLDEYYTRLSGSPCSTDDAGSFSYKSFLGGMLSKSRSMSSKSTKSEPFAKKFLYPSISLLSSQTPRSSSTLDGSGKSKEIRQVIDPSWTVANKGSKLGALGSSYPESYEEYILSESVSSASDMEVGSTFAKKFLFHSISLSSSQTSKSKISQISPRSCSTLDGSEKSKEIRQVIYPSWTVANALVSTYPESYEECILSESVSSASDMEVGSTSLGSIASLTRLVEERPTPKSILFRRELSSNSSFQDQAILSTSDDETACKMYTLSVENSNTTDSTLDTKSVENSYTTSVESQQETTTSSSASNEDTENSWTKRKRQLLPPLHPRTNLAGIRAGKLGVLLQ